MIKIRNLDASVLPIAIPAQAGNHRNWVSNAWAPAFAGVTGEGSVG